MNLNQLTMIGFIGRDAETKQLPNGTPLTKFSVATTRSWKDEKGEWKEETQWHNVLSFGPRFAQMASRLVKGTHVFVRGELTTREYDRTITVPKQQLAVDLKADAIRIFDRAGKSASSKVTQMATRRRCPPLTRE
jgi:single-strand DNA-binding protein